MTGPVIQTVVVPLVASQPDPSARSIDQIHQPDPAGGSSGEVVVALEARLPPQVDAKRAGAFTDF